MKGFVDCTHCGAWSDIPPGFDERKTFAVCPCCHNRMVLNRSMDAVKDLAYSLAMKVAASTTTITSRI